MNPIDARIEARKKAIGNIKLIGELGKLDLVSEAILHKCLKTLLKRGTNENVAERCEDLECLTKIMQTVGKKLDQGQGKNLMDQYLERIKKIQQQKDLPLRIKFILQDILELREKNWIPRLALIEKETKLTDDDGNLQSQITYKYQPAQQQQQGQNSMIPQMSGPFAYPFHTTQSPGGLFQRTPFHPSILQRPRNNAQVASDRYQFERLNPLVMGNDTNKNASTRQSYRPVLSPKSRHRQHDTLTNPYDSTTSSKDTDGKKLTNGNTNRSLTPPSHTNGLPVTNGNTTRPNSSVSSSSSSSSSVPFALRPKQPFHQRTMTDREEMNSSLVAKSISTTNSETNKQQITTQQSSKPTSSYHKEIVNNHPLSKNANNLSSLIKAKEPPHHHHHSTSTKTTISQLPTTIISSPAASTMTRTELLAKYDSFLQMSLDDLDQIVGQIRCLKLTKNQTIDMIQYLFDRSLREHNQTIHFLARLLVHLYKHTLLTTEQCIHGLTNILEKIHDYENELALFKSDLAVIIANLILTCLTIEQDDLSGKNNSAGLLTSSKKANSTSTSLLALNDVCNLLKDGQYHPLFLLVLQHLQQLSNNDEVYMYNLLERYRIDMRDMLPASERQDSLLLQVLEDRRLAYLCPYLKLRVELLDKLSSPSIDANEFLNFVDNQAQIYDRQNKFFIETLVTCIYERAISFTLASSSGASRPDKISMSQEKTIVEIHRQCLQIYLKTIEQQVWALYALQLIAYKNNFPKELLLRLFVYSYDLDIIEEDAYYKWKEDINDDIPGKGKALFQVTKWLQWLEHASEESDNDNEHDNNKEQQSTETSDQQQLKTDGGG